MPLPEEVPYEVVLRGIEVGKLSVEGFANFLRDLVFLHDRLWIIATGQELKPGMYFYSRYGRRVPADQRLELIFVRQGSPLEIGIIIRSAPFVVSAALAFVQIIRALRLLPGEKKKQDLEIEELEAKKSERQKQVDDAARVAFGELARNEDFRRPQPEMEIRVIRRDIERISENQLRITEIEIRRSTKVK